MVYDFDGTLIPGNMQEQGLLPSLGYKNPKKFWEKVKENSDRYKMDQILSYLYLLQQEASDQGMPLSPEKLGAHGSNINNYFAGLVGAHNWFERLKAFVGSLEEQGEFPCRLEHYIISSGHQEMIEHTPIAQYMTEIFASQYAYRNQQAFWPARDVNYTVKTQFLFRISKGATDVNSDKDQDELNRKFSDKEYRIPFRRFIYIGDGITDVPSFSVITKNQGYSIAVHPPSQDTKPPEALHGRISRYLPADYSGDRAMERYVRSIISSMYHHYCAQHLGAP